MYVWYVCMYVCMYVSRYRTALSIVRDRQALQAEFLKSVIVGILIALIFFGRLLFLQMYVCMFEGDNDRSGSHNYTAIHERCT